MFAAGWLHALKPVFQKTRKVTNIILEVFKCQESSGCISHF